MSEMQISGFEMIEKLGAGAMATVWKARQVSLDRIVAIKILSSKLAAAPSDIQRFQAEAQSAAKLKHSGIVQVYDANVEGGLYYFVMEYIAGYTVGDWLRRKGVLSEKDALLVAECVADALDYAWNKARIIHCDVKPSNVIIDSDGAVKVADLGLARTISAMSAESVSEEIMGTPVYISPEQARGEPDLDCRADIYSLGAMLYHLVTGKLLFQGYPQDRVMEMQVTDTVESPLDINPKLSVGICRLIEKMLAKDKEARQKDWESVRVDIARVKRRHVPRGEVLPEGASTVRASTKETEFDYIHAARPEKKETAVSPAVKMLIAAGLIGIAVLGIYLLNLSRRPPPPRTPPTVQQPVDTVVQEEEADQNAREMYEFAEKYVAKNPGRYDEAIGRFQRVVMQTRGTKYSLMAEDEIRKLVGARQEEVEKILRSLEKEAAHFVESEQPVEAAKIYETYSGPMAAETEKRRASIANILRERHERLEIAMRSKKILAKERIAEVLDSVASELVTGGVAPARDIVAGAMAAEELAGKQEDLKTLEKLLDDAADVDKRILDSFRALKGKQVTVQLTGGRKTFVVVDVTDDKVIGSQKVDRGEATASISVAFGVKNLAPRERLLRMGSDDLPDVAMVKGLMALGAKAYPRAKKYFEKTHPMLAERLAACVQDVEQKLANEEAENALGRLMKSIGISVGPYDQPSWIEAIAHKKFTPAGAVKISEAVENYRRQHGSTDFAGKAEPVLVALAEVQQKAAEVQEAGAQTVKPIVLPRRIAEVEGDKDAVVKMLIDVNPEVVLDEIRVLIDGQGKTYRVEMISPGVEDIGPVAALKEIREFCCGAVPPDNTWANKPVCKLNDISPLKGLPLQYLYLGLTSVKDLTPVKGMSLRELHVRNTPVADLAPLKYVALEKLDLRNTKVKNLAPLKGMKLKELNISGTRVFDFKPLAGMPLEHLDLNHTQFKDMAVLKGMPLKGLNLACTKVYNFSILRDMSLNYLNLEGTQIKDISSLRDMPLKGLYLGNTGVDDISVLRGMALTDLSLPGTAVRDFSPIRGMPLRELDISKSRIEDLFLLEGMPLHRLNISDTNVDDLSALGNMNLRYLNISGTRVKDLRPIRRMPLHTLDCRGIAAKDFRPLRGMPVKSICIDNPEGPVRRVLRSMPELRQVNWEYWERW